MISLAALFKGRKSLLKTKKEKLTSAGTGHDLENRLNLRRTKQKERGQKLVSHALKIILGALKILKGINNF